MSDQSRDHLVDNRKVSMKIQIKNVEDNNSLENMDFDQLSQESDDIKRLPST